MKKDRASHEMKYLKKQLPKLRQQAAETKDSKLWHLESVIRGRIKSLKTLQHAGLGDYREVYEGYMRLLEEVSVRLLDHYNKRKGTGYDFDEIVRENHKAYVTAGIISALVTGHIPKKVTEEFKRLLPENPRDDYPQTRQMKRQFYLHLGQTNTGKTHNALQRLKEGKSGVYLAPLRILALEIFERLNAEGVPCSLLTGEEEIITPGAQHISCTVEKADIGRRWDVAVIDEVQMVADLQRGDAWTRAILGLRCPEIHLCGAINVREQLVRMLKDCGDEVEIREYTRLVPLKIQRGRVNVDQVQEGDALVAFSKRRVLSLSRYLAAKGIKNSVIYGDLPPEVRRMQYDSFISGENKVLVSTDAIGMGVNLPIRRIIFTETRKFDGEEYRPLTSQEVKQIAGRAGRIGIFPVGYVASAEGEIPFIQEALEAEDEEIEQAVVGPGEAILNIGMLPLREKLALWAEGEEALSYYRKKDVRDYIVILDSLKPYRLPERTQWQLMALPFDVGNEELMAQFIAFVEEHFVFKAFELTKPAPIAHDLSALEIYYQRVNLYYSFSKALGLPFDEQWVYETRKEVGAEINSLL